MLHRICSVLGGKSHIVHALSNANTELKSMACNVYGFTAIVDQLIIQHMISTTLQARSLLSRACHHVIVLLTALEMMPQKLIRQSNFSHSWDTINWW